jgi:hypothetical protein
MPGVSSVQITFHEDRPPERHAMPPGGFRLAIVNAWTLAAGLAGREKLRAHFRDQDFRDQDFRDQGSAVRDQHQGSGIGNQNRRS